MSLSGTMVCLFYIALYPLAKNYVSLKWRYHILKIAILFFLIPFSEYKYLILGVIYDMFPSFWKRFCQVSANIDAETMIIVSHDQMWLSPKTKGILLVMAVAGIIACFIIIRQMIWYRTMIRLYLDTSEKSVNQRQQKVFFRIKEELKLTKNIRFICSKHCKSPMTSGILSPVVVFPAWDEYEIDADLYEYMVKHELVHIKHHDLLIKFMSVLVLALHWFNPFSYFLYYELSSISEMYCDSIVMQGKAQEERYKYAEMILDLAADNMWFNKIQLFAGAANSRNRIVYKRRVLEMKNNKKYKTALSIIMTGVICMAGGITAFAYEAPNKVSNDNGLFFENESFITGQIELPEFAEIPYDSYFVDNQGNIFNIDSNGIESRALCNHKFEEGTYTKHNLHSNGGCVITYYEGQRCNICGFTKIGEEIASTTYKKCPH